MLLLCIFANKIVVIMENIKWIHPKTKIGPPAEGDSYIRRQYINDEFWREINKGNHILFTAPRRVGKTSIMKDLEVNCLPDYICRYENIESDRNQKQFFKHLFNILLNQLNTFRKTKNKVSKWIKSRGIGEISIEGNIKFIKKELDYKDELLSLIEELNKMDHKVVLFLDEFPEVVSSIKKNEGKEQAINMLHTLRAIRQNENFSRFILVLAGSIGLEQVVETLDRPKLINELHRIRISPLSKNEAIQLIKQLTDGASMQIGKEQINYILKKIDNLIPYFIQLIIEESDTILNKQNRTELQNEDIEMAFDNIVIHDENLQDWESRLKPPYLNKNAYGFCKEVLTICAFENKISLQQIYNLANKWKQKDEYMKRVKMLERDGYIVGENRFYLFVSPILQVWWKRQHPEFEFEK
jgi:hypothetical protein